MEKKQRYFHLPADKQVMKSLNLLKLIRATFSSKEVLDAARLKNGAFTRNYKMPFRKVLHFMLDMRKTTLQTRLNIFFSHEEKGESISQQAFSKLRANFDHSPFVTVFRYLVNEEYSGKHSLKTWNGYHLFSVDGSYLQLPRVDKLRNVFGVRDSGTCPNAGISILFDVLHGFALDPIITVARMNERIQCKEHMDFLCGKLPNIAKKTILLLDRGYPSQKLITEMHQKSLKFVVRCSSQFLKPINTAPMGDSVVVLSNGVSVRIIKFLLENGEVETLATNLFDLQMDTIVELYTLRWGIESMYFKLKRELCIEKFSGKTPNSVRQDFWVSMVLINAVAVFQHEADCAVKERQNGKSLKHEYRARTSDLIITLRDRFIFTSLYSHPMLTELEIRKIIKIMARAVSSLRPGRSFQRIFNRNYNFRFNNLSHL